MHLTIKNTCAYIVPIWIKLSSFSIYKQNNIFEKWVKSILLWIKKIPKNNVNQVLSIVYTSKTKTHTSDK